MGVALEGIEEAVGVTVDDCDWVAEVDDEVAVGGRRAEDEDDEGCTCFSQNQSIRFIQAPKFYTTIYV